MMKNTIKPVSEAFDLALIKYFRAMEKKMADHYSANFASLIPDKLEMVDGHQFVKINRIGGHGGRSVYCFISKYDNETKALGKIKSGDLMKAASWRQPAKHARGNIIENCEKAIENSGPYGVAYLK